VGKAKVGPEPCFSRRLLVGISSHLRFHCFHCFRSYFTHVASSSSQCVCGNTIGSTYSNYDCSDPRELPRVCGLTCRLDSGYDI
jgi:hypothetical protein